MEMKFQDIEIEIHSIIDQIITKYAPNKTILFGSAVWGDPDKINDLDFLIMKEDVPFPGNRPISGTGQTY